MSDAGDGAGKTCLIGVEVGVGGIAQREQQTRRQTVGDAIECSKHLVAAETEHRGKQTTSEEARTLLEQGQGLVGIVGRTCLIDIALPGGIGLLVENVEDFGEMLHTLFSRVFAETEGMEHSNPHAAFGVHNLGCLLG